MSHTVDAAAAWIYRGVWAGIVALFKVPPEPPTLPSSGEAVRSIRPSAGFLRYLKFFFWVAFLPGDIVPLLLWLAVSVALPLVGAILIVPLVIVLIAPDVIAYVGLHLRYDTTWYVLTDRSLRIRRGIWVIHETTITFENVQNVEVAQGPVQRLFGIADVIVQTAGGGGSRGTSHGGEKVTGAHVGVLQGLDNAADVRDLILDRVRRSRTTGLGDEHAISSAHANHATRSEYSVAHLAVLREIRDEARRLTAAASP
ncbi:MAG TPA: PH domain-containing protein [Vicinamibacterales bacterium]|nr:PH domain-containing protein [Vicinamibacterales bacterium]